MPSLYHKSLRGARFERSLVLHGLGMLPMMLSQNRTAQKETSARAVAYLNILAAMLDLQFLAGFGFVQFGCGG